MFIVPLFVTAAAISRIYYRIRKRQQWGSQIILFMYGKFLLVMQIILAVAQTSMNVQRPHPYCQDIITLQYPSTTAFFAASGSTYLALFTYLWNVPLSWIYWSVVLLFFAVPPSILVWFQVNTWGEVFVSCLIGVVTTSLFLLLTFFLVVPQLPVLVHVRPFSWFNAIDTHGMSMEQRDWSEEIGMVLERADVEFGLVAT